MSTPGDDQTVNLPAPSIGSSLSAALDEMKAIPMRRPWRELAWFLTLSLAFWMALIASFGLRKDFGELPLLWIAPVGLVWFTSFAASAFLVFVPARKQVVPRSRQIYQMLIVNLLALIALGLLASHQGVGASSTYDLNLHSFLSHAGGCSTIGFAAGAVAGTIALFVFYRFVPVGGISVGIGLGAAGGTLAGSFLLFHCPINERMHMALAHTSSIATAALFVALASWLLRRER